MIRVSIAAFLGTYFSVFHAPRMGLFWCFLLPLLIWLIYKAQNHVRAVFVFVFFVIWTQAAILWQFDSRYNIAIKETITLELKIIELPKNKSNTAVFMAKPLKIIKSNSDFDFLTLKKIKINWYQATQQIKGGQIWRMTIRLQPPHGYQNRGGFDYERWMFAEGISATAYVKAKKAPPVLIAQSSDVVLKARSWLSEKIATQAKDLEYVALFQTLSIGDKTGLSDELKQVFINTGTAHLLVISGLHVGLLSLMFYFLASRLWVLINKRIPLSVNQRDFSVYWAWCAAFIYAALAGFSLPTLRALIMLSVFYWAFLKRQTQPLLNVFCLALVIILLWQPLALLSMSFWLSFLAVLLIVLSQYGLSSMSKFKAILGLQFLFALLFIPLNAIVFKQMLLSSFFANLVLIPVMSFVVIPLNLLATFLVSVQWSGTIYLYQFLDVLIGFLLSYLNGLTSIMGEPIVLSDKHLVLMLISAFGAILLVSIRKMGLNLVALFLMVLPWVYWQEPLKQSSYQVNFFDIGMGTAIVVSTKNHTLLYDLGPGNQSSYQPAKWVILPYLKAVNRLELDKVVVSHSDQDHYGGFWPLLKDGIVPKSINTGSPVKIKTLLTPDQTIKSCHAIPPWSWDGVTFNFLPLILPQEVNDNNQSCVLHIKSSFGSVLLAGDIEQKREAELLANYKEYLKSDVLLVPHHGSKTSSSMAFLQAVQADYAVVTSGYLNHWGFPKKEVMLRYDALAVRWFNTAVDGSVLFQFDSNGIQASTYRSSNPAFWY